MNAKQMLFLRSVIPAALACARQTGIPASVTIAQAVLESGWGASELAREGNNLFGIKATDDAPDSAVVELPTEEVLDGERVTVLARFARYPDVAACFAAHAALLASPRYAAAMAVRGNPQAFARALQTCGYSTDPRYAAMLAALMQEFDLTQYDAA